MDTTTTQWAQGFEGGVNKSMEGSRKPRPQKEQGLNCPRCNSTHTKFCYYNNYNLSQPRYFCKTCRRYWTEGGSLRNVPVGGGSRKNKMRSISTSSSSSLSSKKILDRAAPPIFSQPTSQNPKIQESQDLNLAYPPTSLYDSIPEFSHLPYNNSMNSTTTPPIHPNPNNSSLSHHQCHLSAMDLIKNGITYSNNSIYTSGLPFQEMKPSLHFSMNNSNLQGVQEESGVKLFFPLEDLKQGSTSNTPVEFEHNNRRQGAESDLGCWNGMLGGGSW